MSTHVISGTIAYYNMFFKATYLSITSTGSIVGPLYIGVYNGATHNYTVVSNGRITGAAYGQNGFTSLTNGSTNHSALIEGVRGVDVELGGRVTNFGTVRGTGHHRRRDHAYVRGAGIALETGGRVINGSASDTKALVRGYEGVTSYPFGIFPGMGYVSNFGTIESQLSSGGLHGVLLEDGGAVTNGSTADHVAYIGGFQSGVATQRYPSRVHNYGRIVAVEAAAGQAGISLGAGGYVGNDDSVATIKGFQGVIVRGGKGTVVNSGVILGTGETVRGGVALYDGGVVTNKSGAEINGREGVTAEGKAATVTNLGLIVSNLTSPGLHGVWLAAGGAVTNGSASNEGASVLGYQSGVAALSGALTVHNYGYIKSFATVVGQAGVSAHAAGDVFNGTSKDSKAEITGAAGVLITGSGRVDNYGTILGASATSGYGVEMDGGGTFNNGSTGRIQGYGGLRLNGSGVNLGTITSTARYGDYGALVFGTGSSLTNGSATDATARISGGYTGVKVSGAGTLVNYGVISSTGREAVIIANPTGTLDVGAGATFNGGVSGGGGALVLGSGTGTISNLFVGHDVTVSGSMPSFTFDDFATAGVGAHGRFTLAGDATVASGETLTDAGALTAADTITVQGGLVVSGSLSGAGAVALDGGSATFNDGASLSVATINQAGALVTVAATAATCSSVWTQAAGNTLALGLGGRIDFTGVGDTFAGTLTGTGTVSFSGGSDILTSVVTSTTTTLVVNTATVTLSGSETIENALTETAGELVVAAAGATLIGAGRVTLVDAARSKVEGVSAAATLTNLDDTIAGAGLLGDGELSLTNGAAGVIDGDAATALTINTGTGKFANGGLVEATGAGGAVISSAVDNTGTLAALGGRLFVEGAVSGGGEVEINGGTADMRSAFSENVVFTGPTGVLELAQSQSYSGTVTGFSTAGTTSLDLLDIAFGLKTKVSYAGSTSSIVVTVTDGTHTAKIHLAGDFAGSTFLASSDGHGGTSIVDPAAPSPGRRPVAHFIQSAAAFSGPGGPSPDVGAYQRSWRPTLAPPRLAQP